MLVVGVIIGVVVIGGFIFVNHFKTMALPNYNKDIKLSGLIADVTVCGIHSPFPIFMLRTNMICTWR